MDLIISLWRLLPLKRTFSTGSKCSKLSDSWLPHYTHLPPLSSSSTLAGVAFQVGWPTYPYFARFFCFSIERWTSQEPSQSLKNWNGWSLISKSSYNILRFFSRSLLLWFSAWNGVPHIFTWHVLLLFLNFAQMSLFSSLPVYLRIVFPAITCYSLSLNHSCSF